MYRLGQNNDVVTPTIEDISTIPNVPAGDLAGSAKSETEAIAEAVAAGFDRASKRSSEAIRLASNKLANYKPTEVVVKTAEITGEVAKKATQKAKDAATNTGAHKIAKESEEGNLPDVLGIGESFSIIKDGISDIKSLNPVKSMFNVEEFTESFSHMKSMIGATSNILGLGKKEKTKKEDSSDEKEIEVTEKVAEVVKDNGNSQKKTNEIIETEITSLDGHVQNISEISDRTEENNSYQRPTFLSLENESKEATSYLKQISKKLDALDDLGGGFFEQAGMDFFDRRSKKGRDKRRNGRKKGLFSRVGKIAGGAALAGGAAYSMSGSDDDDNYRKNVEGKAKPINQDPNTPDGKDLGKRPKDVSKSSKSSSKAASKIGKSFLSKIPGIGLAIKGADAAGSLMDGDMKGAGLSLASGLLSMIPVIGTAAALGIDAYDFMRDDESNTPVSPDIEDLTDTPVISESTLKEVTNNRSEKEMLKAVATNNSKQQPPVVVQKQGSSGESRGSNKQTKQSIDNLGLSLANSLVFEI